MRRKLSVLPLFSRCFGSSASTLCGSLWIVLTSWMLSSSGLDSSILCGLHLFVLATKRRVYTIPSSSPQHKESPTTRSQVSSDITKTPPERWKTGDRKPESWRRNRLIAPHNTILLVSVLQWALAPLCLRKLRSVAEYYLLGSLYSVGTPRLCFFDLVLVQCALLPVRLAS